MFMQLFNKLVTKKKLIGWISAIVIAITAAAVSLDQAEVKSAICGTEVTK